MFAEERDGKISKEAWENSLASSEASSNLVFKENTFEPGDRYFFELHVKSKRNGDFASGVIQVDMRHPPYITSFISSKNCSEERLGIDIYGFLRLYHKCGFVRPFAFKLSYRFKRDFDGANSRFTNGGFFILAFRKCHFARWRPFLDYRNRSRFARSF